jgi:hypothetical protein
MLCPAELRAHNAMFKSGRPDLNWGPPAPKAGALTRLRYAPAVVVPKKISVKNVN